jgi:hypothetical protein
MHEYFTLDEEKSLLQWLMDVREGPGYLGILDLRGWNQKYFSNIEELLPLIKKYRDTANLYISMASFRSSNLNRSKENAINLRSFWLDLDSHGDGKYKCPEDALSDVTNFINDSRLPSPNYIHLTGHGIHAIWATNQTISTTEWLQIARALRELAEEYGLDIDGEVTTDPARVLRVPYTINFRDRQSPIPTKLLGS